MKGQMQIPQRIKSLKEIEKKQKSLLENAMKNKIVKLKVEQLVKEFARKLIKRISNKKKVVNTKVQKLLNQKRNLQSSQLSIKTYKKSLYLITITYLLIVLMMILISSFQIFSIGFKINIIEYQSVWIINSICLILMVIKLITQFLIRHSEISLIQSKGREIRKIDFITYRIIVVFLTIIAMVVFMVWRNNKIAPAIFLITLSLNLSHIGDSYDEIVEQLNNRTLRLTLRLLKLVLIGFILGNHISVILVSLNQIDETKSWVFNFVLKFFQVQFRLIEWYELYMFTFYWSTSILLTIGFGDFNAVRWQQAVAISFLMTVTVLYFGYVLSVIGLTISNIKQRSQDTYNNQVIFNRMKCNFGQNNHKVENIEIKQQRILQNIQKNIEQSYFQKEELEEYEEFMNIIRKMPFSLKSQYFESIAKITFANHPVFKQYSNSHVQLIQKFKPERYYPSQLIAQSYCALSDIIIMKTGLIGLTFKNSLKIPSTAGTQTLKIDEEEENILINTELFQPGTVRRFDINAQQYSSSIKISLLQFQQILRQNCQNWQYYQQQRHKQRFINIDFYTKCFFCYSQKNPQIQSSLHTALICPTLHYISTNRDKLLNTYNLKGNKMYNPDFHYKRQKTKSRALFLYKTTFKRYEHWWQIQSNTQPIINNYSNPQFYLPFVGNMVEGLSTKQIIKKSIQNHLCKRIDPQNEDKNIIIQYDKIHSYDYYFKEFNLRQILQARANKKQEQIEIQNYQKLLILQTFKTGQDYPFRRKN